MNALSAPTSTKRSFLRGTATAEPAQRPWSILSLPVTLPDRVTGPGCSTKAAKALWYGMHSDYRSSSYRSSKLGFCISTALSRSALTWTHAQDRHCCSKPPLTQLGMQYSCTAALRNQQIATRSKPCSCQDPIFLCLRHCLAERWMLCQTGHRTGPQNR
jgi:hypothetical protein